MAYLLWHYLRDSARLHPDRPSVQSDGVSLTYRELDDASSRLATALTQAGLRPGDRFGLYMPKTARSVVVTHAASKAGAAYVPIDPNAPPRRAAFILGNCEVRGVATTAAKLSQLLEFLDEMPAVEVVLVIDDATVETGERLRQLTWSAAQQTAPGPLAGESAVENDPAYLLYTSGSTGSPKGVIISHRNAMAFVDWAAETFDIGPQDRLSNHAPLHFDLSVLDIYAALRSGAVVKIVPEGLAYFPVELAGWIEREEIFRLVFGALRTDAPGPARPAGAVRVRAAALRPVCRRGLPHEVSASGHEALRECALLQSVWADGDKRLHVLRCAIRAADG